MERQNKVVLGSMGAAVLGLAGAARVGHSQWRNTTAQLVEQVLEQGKPNGEIVFRIADLDGLPAPVVRYFQRVLRDGQQIIQTARVNQKGTIRVRLTPGHWHPFEATQHFSTNPPGFVWDARVRFAPLAAVRVRDTYIDGKGSIVGKVASAVKVVDTHDKSELNIASLQRYLAEAVWFPTALLPSQGVEWSAIDDENALATLVDGETTASLEFRFDEEGQITRIFTPERYREVDGAYEATPWAVRVWSYEEKDGIRIPVVGEAEWILPEGQVSYWRGRIEDVVYSFVQQPVLEAVA